MHIFERPPTPSCHASTIVETEPGQLAAAWFGGKEEGAKDVQIWLARFNGKTWSEPEVVGTEPGQPCWNPVLFTNAKGKLLLWYKAGPSPQTWTGFLRISEDGAKTWTKPQTLPAGFYGPVRAKPILLADGTILAGTSLESHRCWSPYVDRSTDHGITWTRSTPFGVDGKFGQIQPTLYPIGEKGVEIVALMRSKDPRSICSARSADGGKTFGPATPIELANPNSGIDVVRTGKGDLFLIYNPTIMLRSPLSLARSTDDGKTWKKVFDLETELGEFSYPAMIESKAGTLEITYTWKRKHISHVSVDPAKFRE
jgi:predicted neuraminidase